MPTESFRWKPSGFDKSKRALRISNSCLQVGLPIQMGNAGGFGSFVQAQRVAWPIQLLQAEPPSRHQGEETLPLIRVNRRELLILSCGALKVLLTLEMTAQVEP